MTYLNASYPTCTIMPISAAESSLPESEYWALFKDLAVHTILAIGACLLVKMRYKFPISSLKVNESTEIVQKVSAKINKVSVLRPETIATLSNLIKNKKASSTLLNVEEKNTVTVLIETIKQHMNTGHAMGSIKLTIRLGIDYDKINKYLNENYSNLTVSYSCTNGFKWFILL